MIPLDLARLKEPSVIAEAVYAGLEQEVRDETFLSQLGEEQRSYLRDYYAHLLRWPRFFRYHFVQKLEILVQQVLTSLAYQNSVQVLDVACGPGSQALVAGLLGAEVHGIDLDVRSIEIAQRRLELYEDHLGHSLMVTFSCGDATKIGDLPLPPQDIIFSQQAVMLFHPINGFLEGAARLLRPGGSLIITCGNTMHPVNRVRQFLRSGRFEFRFESHRPLSPREMRSRFEANGFKVRLLRGHGCLPPFVIEPSERMFRLAVRLERRFSRSSMSYLTGLTYLIVGDKGTGN